MFPDYKLLVFQEYERKMADKALSVRLIQPSPAQIRDECEAVCAERYDRKDEQVLRTFFGHFADKAACLKAIERCEIDDFRPLQKFLKKPSIRTEPKNVELLAWLIDFEPRPYDYERTYVVNILEVRNNEVDEMEEEGHNVRRGNALVAPIESTEEVENVIAPAHLLPVKREARAVYRSTLIAALAIIFLGVGGYWFWNNGAGIGNGGCMYWAGDHYQQIPCNPKPDDTLVIALDPEKINNFKRITTLSSIDKKSIGRVWYVKVNDTIEFYTSDGFHPTELQLRLKPITKYIIEKYVP